MFIQEMQSNSWPFAIKKCGYPIVEVVRQLLLVDRLRAVGGYW